jgi:hypothetical protein
MTCKGASAPWLAALRRYLLTMVVAQPIWEAVQLPLYTVWSQGDRRRILVALAHCTAGDLLIASSSLVIALLLAGGGWPAQDDSYRRVAWLAILLGVAYTLFSEWLNVEVLKSWAYSPLMPVVPGLGIGLSPILQWILLPALGFAVARRRNSTRSASSG